MSVKIKAIFLILIILIIDQVSKVFIKLNFAIGDYVEVFSWFQIYFIENPGMAFGMEFGGKLFLAIVRIIAVVFLIFYISRLIKKQARAGYILTIALFMAGAAGNIFDSVFYGVLFSESTYQQVATFLPEGGGYAPLFYGKVVDMLYFPIITNSAGQTIFFSPVFNIADSAITVSVFLVLIFFRKELNESLESKKRRMPKFQNKYYFFFIFLLFFACSNRPKDVLSIREMTEVLVDIHTLDGIFTTDEYRDVNMDEKNKYYEAVLRDHKIDQAQFDSSIVWYSRDPKKFEKIYVRVIDRLTNEEELVKKGKYHDILSVPAVFTAENIWKDSTRFILKNIPSGRNQLRFSIADSALMTQDLYILRFLHRIEPTDSCKHQAIHFNIYYANGQVDSIYYPTRNDGKFRKYSLGLYASRKEKIDSLTGRILASDTCSFAQNAWVDSISLSRIYNKAGQEELRNITERHEEYRNSPYRLFPLPDDRFGFTSKNTPKIPTPSPTLQTPLNPLITSQSPNHLSIPRSILRLAKPRKGEAFCVCKVRATAGITCFYLPITSTFL